MLSHLSRASLLPIQRRCSYVPFKRLLTQIPANPLRRNRLTSFSPSIAMEALFQEAVEQNEMAKKPESSVPWKLDQPHAQSFHTYDGAKQTWEPTECKPLREANGPHGITRLALFSWNIDFMLPLAKPRMDAALEHLDGLVSKLGPETAVVIYLQECLEKDDPPPAVHDLATIGEKEWVRSKFNVTDVDQSNWGNRYGTTTLVDRRLDVTSCFRVHYQKSNFQRDAFFVDVVLNNSQGQRRTVRLCNTHLESLAGNPPLRPAQMRIAATYMREDGIDAALAAGDFNAIQPFDKTLHSDNGLRDAYLELGGQEDSEDGYTWGQQAATTLRDRFGCSRMDKVYFTGNLKLESFERFGADVELTDEADRAIIMLLGFDKPWITDHLGVMAMVEVV